MRQHAVKLIVAALFAAFAGLFLTTRPAPAKTLIAVAKHWRTFIVVEQFQAVQETKPQTDNANESELPVDAYNVQFVTRQNCNTEQTVIDHTPAPLSIHCDKGLYAEYFVNRWLVARVVDITGNERDPLRFPGLTINHGQCLGCEREMQRHAEYYVDFLYNGQTVTYQANSRAEWEGIGIEMPYAVQLDPAQGIDWFTLKPG